MNSIIRGGVLAAGEGSRLRRDGFDLPKPLVRVAGAPLVDHAIRNLLDAGLREIAIIFNGDEEDCADWVRRRFPDPAPQILIRTTASSLESFREVSRRLSPGRALMTTVDAFCAREDFARFTRSAEALGEDATALAVTRLVDDERPVWVRADPTGRIRSIGGTEGDAVTAGFYVFSQRARRLADPARNLARLRDFLAWLVASGEPVHAIEVGDVIDIDRGSDVEAAERLAFREAAAGRELR